MHKLLWFSLVAAGLGLGGCSCGTGSTAAKRTPATSTAEASRTHYSDTQQREFRVNNLARELRASGEAKDWNDAQKLAAERIGSSAPPPPMPQKRKATRELTVAEMDAALGKTRQ